MKGRGLNLLCAFLPCKHLSRIVLELANTGCYLYFIQLIRVDSLKTWYWEATVANGNWLKIRYSPKISLQSHRICINKRTRNISYLDVGKTGPWYHEKLLTIQNYNKNKNKNKKEKKKEKEVLKFPDFSFEDIYTWCNLIEWLQLSIHLTIFDLKQINNKLTIQHC